MQRAYKCGQVSIVSYSMSICFAQYYHQWSRLCHIFCKLQVITTTSQSLKHLEYTKGPMVRSHPIYTPTMVLIEGVASLVRGDLVDHNDILPEDPYLCTGFDIYLAEEPDLMSSMALVHSRIRRVVYMKSHEGSGALGSKMHLHQLRSLNHKFRVFRVRLN